MPIGCKCVEPDAKPVSPNNRVRVQARGEVRDCLTSGEATVRRG